MANKKMLNITNHQGNTNQIHRDGPLGYLFLQVLSNSFATPWTAAHQAPLSILFPRQEYWSGLPFLSPGHLSDPGIEPASPALAGRFFTAEPSVRLWQGPAFRRCPRFPCGSQPCPPRIQAVCVSPSSEFQRNNWSCYPSEGFIMGPPKVQSPG